MPVASGHILSGSDLQYPDSIFVGRKPELFKLGSALERAKAGSGSVFLLSGEAGVGKTRLAAEFAQFAQAGGAKVLEGQGNAPLRETSPFGVWNQILSNRLTRSHSQINQIQLESNPGPAPLTSPQHSVAHSAGPELFEATARILVEDARTQPLVVILDDLHAADTLSLQAFRVLARELSRFKTIVVGVYRDSEIRRFQEFAELLRDSTVRDSKRIPLTEFAQDEVRRFLELRTQSPVDPGMLQLLYDLSGGNPRLLDIALRHHLLEQSSLPAGRLITAVLQAEIESHLESLSPQAREALTFASVIGVEFRLSSLAHAVEQSPSDLLDSLAEAEQAGLLLRSGTAGRYRFRQSLVQEMLYGELAGSHRACLHKRFGEVLERLHEYDTAFLNRIARHFYEAALVGCAEKAVDYCCRAAEHERTNEHPKEAAQFYEMALSALELQGSSPSEIEELKLKLEELERQKNRGPDGRARTVQATAIKRGAGREGAPARAPHRAATENLPETDENTFRKEGDFWTLTFEKKTLRVKDCNGLKYVAHLLQHPGREFHAIQLAAIPNRTGGFESTSLSRADRQNLSVRSSLFSDAGPILDASAKTAYRRRVEGLRHEVEEARSYNDLTRLSKLEEELGCVESELGRALGIAGRDRKHSSESERARVNVTNAVRSLVKRIRGHHPSLARYLSNTIKTGYFCSHNPDPQFPHAWRM